MNTLRLRAIKLSPDYGVGAKNPFASQFSCDGLVWWTFHRGETIDECVKECETMKAYVIANQLIRPTHIIWTDKV